MPAIHIERLAFAYTDAVPLLDDVELHLSTGLAGMVGPNGAGKSTLARLIVGPLIPTRGRVVIDPGDALVVACSQDVAACPAIDEPLGRSVFVGYEPSPRRWLFALASPAVYAGATPVLRDVRVAVGHRDRIRIAGDNGSGKTTLIEALLAAHDLPPDRLLVLPQELPDSAGRALLAETRACAPSCAAAPCRWSPRSASTPSACLARPRRRRARPASSRSRSAWRATSGA